MKMINFFCGMVVQRKAFSIIFSQDHYQSSSPSQISDTLQVGFEPAQNFSCGLVEPSCAVVITNAPRCHITTTPLHITTTPPLVRKMLDETF